MSHLSPLYPTLASVLRHIELSIDAEQVFCSIVTEMELLPQFKDQPDMRVIHKENYETSYHRNTAAGNLQRLLTHSYPDGRRLLLMTVECFIEAREHDRRAMDALGRLRAPTPADQPWIDAARKWHDRRRQQLKLAARKLHAAVGPDFWAKGAALAEPASHTPD